LELIEAKQILKNALNVAVQKGCFSIDDVAVIIEAFKKIEVLQDIEFGEITPI
jgi:hypothetical protein